MTAEDGVPDREQLEREVQVRFFRAGGPGGQHRNVTESGVRLFHPPTGVSASASERRSQAQNREIAFERLIERLRARQRRARPRVPTRKPRGAEERRIEEKRERGRRKLERREPDEPA